MFRLIIILFAIQYSLSLTLPELFDSNITAVVSKHIVRSASCQCYDYVMDQYYNITTDINISSTGSPSIASTPPTSMLPSTLPVTFTTTNSTPVYHVTCPNCILHPNLSDHLASCPLHYLSQVFQSYPNCCLDQIALNATGLTPYTLCPGCTITIPQNSTYSLVSCVPNVATGVPTCC